LFGPKNARIPPQTPENEFMATVESQHNKITVLRIILIVTE
jgi:hypothetical protein